MVSWRIFLLIWFSDFCYHMFCSSLDRITFTCIFWVPLCTVVSICTMDSAFIHNFLLVSVWGLLSFWNQTSWGTSLAAGTEVAKRGSNIGIGQESTVQNEIMERKAESSGWRHLVWYPPKDWDSWEIGPATNDKAGKRVLKALRTSEWAHCREAWYPRKWILCKHYQIAKNTPEVSIPDLS